MSALEVFPSAVLVVCAAEEAAYRKHNPDATLHVIEGSGHTNLMEEPELSAAVVIEFLQLVAAKRAATV